MKKRQKKSGILWVGIILTALILAFFVYKNKFSKHDAVTPVVSALSGKISWGAFTGDTDNADADFEKMIGAKMPISAMFWSFDEPFPKTNVGKEGKTLVFYWEPSFGYSKINDGSKDRYIAQFASDMKDYGYPIILAPFDEPNLNENDWGSTKNGNTPKSFIAAWKRIYEIFQVENADNVSFALVYNNISIPAAPFSDYYPGDSYVDYVGVDGFNFDTQTFAQVFTKALAEARTFKKPVWIFSAGSVAPKSQFIRDLGASGVPWIWFNEKPYEIDKESLGAFKEIIESKTSQQ